MKNELDEKMKQCIEDCSDCGRTCLETSSYCLNQGGDHAETEHINLLKDCAETCKLSENLMLRASDHANDICIICSEICDECARSCEKVDPKDDQMIECASICRQCADSCRNMSS